MKLKYFGAAIFIFSFFIFGALTFAEQIPEKDVARLRTFIKKRFAARLPPDAAIEVNGYEESPIKGFKAGAFVVNSSRGSGEIPFLISLDGRYVVFGDPINTQEFKDTKVGELKQGTIPLGNQPAPVLMTKDGKYMIIGELVDSTVDPAKETMEKISLKDVPVKGPQNSEVTIVEYSDFQCPFCKRAHDMLPQILANYEGKVRVVYKQLPLSIHPWAMGAAVASVCAYEQGNDNFWDFHDLVFENQKQITVQNSSKKFEEFAEQIGLDTNKFSQCLGSQEASGRVQSEIREAQAVGANSTPTFIVNGITVQGADPNALSSAIEASLSSE